jgi:hypothetical protein
MNDHRVGVLTPSAKECAVRSTAKRLLLAWLIVFALAPAAMASLFSPFSFSFFNSALNGVFLFPFRLGGCF